MGGRNRRRQQASTPGASQKTTAIVVEATTAPASSDVPLTTAEALETPEEVEKLSARREEAYWKLREEIMKRDLSNTENFDKSILTLASAALALGVTFLRDHIDGDGFGWLLSSWILHVLAIISTLISYLVSQKGLHAQLSCYHGYYMQNDDEALDGNNWADRLNEWLAYSSATTFTLGIILMLVYFGMNPPNAKGGNDVKRNQPVGTPTTNLPGGMGAKTPSAVPITRSVAPPTTPSSAPPQSGGTGGNNNGNPGK